MAAKPRHLISTPSATLFNVLVALAYFGFGMSAEFLAIPPDFATPVWPAAGIALGCSLIYGNRVLPGILLGAILTNATVAHLQGIAFNPQQLAFATSIAAGATLQAWFASYLLNRFQLSNFEFSDGSKIAKFLLLAGPVGCLVSSLNGATMLGLFGIVPWNTWATNWVTWWVGDTVGALVITPFVIRLLSHKLALAQKSWLSSSLPLGFLLLVILCFFYVRQLEQESRRAMVAETGRNIESRFRSHLYEVQVVLRSLKSFYEASTFVELEEFNLFADNLMSSNDAIVAVEWLPYLRHAQRAELESDMHARGYANFVIRSLNPAGELTVEGNKPDYLPIVYVFPFQPNRAIHGLDILSLPHRESQSRKALTTGNSFATQPLQLLQDHSGNPSYILVAPVRSQLQTQNHGLVEVIFSMEALLVRAMTDAQELDGLGIADITEPTAITQVYGSPQATSPLAWQSEMQLLNRTLRLTFNPGPEFIRQTSTLQSYIVLVGGLLYVAMLEAVLLSLITRQQAIQVQVENKTREIAHAKSEAEDANRAKTDFLASMSHELRTPLNAIIGFTRRVLSKMRGELDPRNEEALQIVEKNALQLLTLINNLLDITKVEKGKLDLSLASVSLRELLREAQTHFSLAAAQKNCTIHLDCPLEGRVEADAARLRQVVQNLLSNAIKFTQGGNITLRLSEHCDPRYLNYPTDQTGFVVQVEDSGVGIAAEDLSKLFNKFQKVSKTAQLNPEGTGLGLVLSKEFVELHGGRIGAYSEPGKGSVFSFWLPVQPPAVTAA